MIPRVHLPSLRGRARADRGALLLAALVVALAAALACAVPAAAERAADDALHATVARAGSDAELVATAPFPPSQDNGSAQRAPESAALTDATFRNTRLTLPPALAAVLRPAVARVTTEPLGVFGHGTGRSIVLAYVTSQTGDPAVVWTSGHAPGASVPPAERDVARDRTSAAWPVEVGLSEPDAAALGVRAGSRIQAVDRLRETVDVRVTGLYRPADERAAVWSSVPHLLRPAGSSDDGGNSYLTVTGLLSRDSLPDMRVAMDEDLVTRQVVYAPEPARIGVGDADAVVAGVVHLQTATTPEGLADDIRWATNLDAVVRLGQQQVTAARAQASALLAGLVTVASLVLVLAADLLARRRAGPLALARVRGATLPGLALELGVESAVLALVGALVGGVVAVALGGDVAEPWLVPILVVALLAPPLAGVRIAAAAGSARRAPANRAARRALDRVRRLRTGAVEVAVVALTVGAFVALRQRGVLGAGSPDLLAAAAPALGAVCGAMLLRRVVPVGARLALRRAGRSRRALPLVVAARAAERAAAVLPFLVVAVSTALLALAASTAATEDRGLDLGSWQAVGGDARAEASASPSVAALASRAARAPGVVAAVAARVVDGASVSGNAGGGVVRLVVVDAGAYTRLLAATPLTAPAQLRLLAGPAAPLPALLRSSQPGLVESSTLRLDVGGREAPLRIVGEAPAVGGAGDDVLLVDAARAAAAGLDVTPNTVWAVGPGATAALASSGAAVTTRAAVRAERVGEPIPAALRRLVAVSTVVLVALGVLGVALGAATSAPARGETLARLRTLGLRRAAARWLVLGELLPATLTAALGGLVVGTVVAGLATAPLALRLVTGGSSDPPLVVPWWIVVPALLVVASLLGVAAVETSVRRRERLGLVLRAGNA